MEKIIILLASELDVKPEQVKATIRLLKEGATVPFIARYRKEATGQLNDEQLRILEIRLQYLTELEERKQYVIKQIEAQEKMTDMLYKQILSVDKKSELEDLYLPYKVKRKTKGQIAIEAGLAPLADLLWHNSQKSFNLFAESSAYINEKAGFDDEKAVLQGAKMILAERIGQDVLLIKKLRFYLEDNGFVFSHVLDKLQKNAEKFTDYFDYHEKMKTIPSHRILALLRGRKLGVLSLKIDVLESQEDALPFYQEMIRSYYQIACTTEEMNTWFTKTIDFAWKVKLSLHLETEFFAQLKERADKEAIHVFSYNLHDLLLMPPAGMKVTLALDPGYRTGCKCVILSATGALLAYDVIFPHAPQKEWKKSLELLISYIKKFKVELIAIGNGTASRETEKLVSELCRLFSDYPLTQVMVSEAGASVYSASKIASDEFPNLDVSYRGAVSIGRRLQDPMAELVKVDPKSIGVGQYQHDVNQLLLTQSLNSVIERCVNSVGVDINTASTHLLMHVSGLNQTLAQKIVDYREKNQCFSSREELLNISRIGKKVFEQCAGFLRIMDGVNILDKTGVHPESYYIVDKMCHHLGIKKETFIFNSNAVKKINPKDFVDEAFGLLSIQDILLELEKPPRDPRGDFKTAVFSEHVQNIDDLKVNMILEGIITNVTHFGAFVDIGVHQDGLVHISSLSDDFVLDPRDIVKTGDVVKVKILQLDIVRKRITLTMRLNEVAEHESTRKLNMLSSDQTFQGNKRQRSSMSEALNKAFETLN